MTVPYPFSVPYVTRRDPRYEGSKGDVARFPGECNEPRKGRGETRESRRKERSDMDDGIPSALYTPYPHLRVG